MKRVCTWCGETPGQEDYLHALKAENKRLRKALEWVKGYASIKPAQPALLTYVEAALSRPTDEEEVVVRLTEEQHRQLVEYLNTAESRFPTVSQQVTNAMNRLRALSLPTDECCGDPDKQVGPGGTPQCLNCGATL